MRLLVGLVTAAGIVLGSLVIILDGAQTKRMALLRGANREGGWLLRISYSRLPEAW